MEENDNVEVLETIDETYMDEIPDTIGGIEIENPDDREYEQINVEAEGGC